MRNRNRLILFAFLALLIVSLPTGVLAGEPGVNPGRDLANWLYNNIAPFFPLGLAAASLWFLFRREFTGFVGFVVFAMVVAVFVYFPNAVRDFASAIWTAITG